MLKRVGKRNREINQEVIVMIQENDDLVQGVEIEQVIEIEYIDRVNRKFWYIGCEEGYSVVMGVD